MLLSDNGLSLNEAAEAKTPAALSTINSISKRIGSALTAVEALCPIADVAVSNDGRNIPVTRFIERFSLNPQYSIKFHFHTYMPLFSVPWNATPLGGKLGRYY